MKTLVGAVTAALVLLLAPASSAEDWPQWSGGPSRNAVRADYPGLDLGTAWTAPLQSSWQPPCVVVAGDRIFSVVYSVDDPGSGWLVAFSRQGGNELWRASLDQGGGPSACPAVDGDNVFLVTNRAVFSYTASGSLNYQVRPADFEIALTTPPLAADGRIYSSGLCMGTGPGRVDGDCHVALDQDDGSLLWEAPGAQSNNPAVRTGNAVANVDNLAPTLRVMNPATGELLWSVSNQFGGVIGDNGTLFFGTRSGGVSQISARNANTGSVLWQYSLGGLFGPYGMAADEERLYAIVDVGVYGLPGRMLAINRESGTLAWQASGIPVGYGLGLLGKGLFYRGETELGGATDYQSGERLGSAQVPALGFGNGAAYVDRTFFYWDRAGSGPWSLRATRDINPPSVTLQTSDQLLTSDQRPNLTWTMNDNNGTGVEDVQVLINGVENGSLGAVTSYRPPSDLPDGAHSWAVRVHDFAGNVVTTPSRSFTVDTTPTPPDARLTASGSPVLTGQQIALDASGSSDPDPDDSIVSYEWDLEGNGSFVPGEATASTSFETKGMKTISVRVTDQTGRTANAKVDVDVRLSPPSGEIGISINGGDIATNKPAVKLRLVWPRLVSNALVSNDGGFVPSQTIPVAQEISWKLRSSGPERQPRIVYVRFRGWEDSPLTFTDDIILDERPPEVIEASGLAGPSSSTRTLKKSKARVVRVRAKDGNSGVATVSVSSKPRGKAVVTKRLVRRGKLGKRKQKTTIRVPKSLKRAFVRVTDVAGNSSRPRRVK